MFELLVSLFLEHGLVCMDEASARLEAKAISVGQVYETDNCGSITGTVVEVRALPTLYVFPGGLGLRVVEGQYLGKTVYFFRMEYSV